MICLHDVCLTFRSTTRHVDALDHVTVDVGPGRICGLLGPAGSGKTTLLRVAAGLVEPDHGQIWLDGRELAGAPLAAWRRARHRIGVLAATTGLLQRRTVAENVALGLLIAGRSRADADLRTDEILHELDLAWLAHRRPSELSEGQRRLAALARALAPHPRVVLCDESSVALGPEFGRTIAARLRAFVDATGAAALLVGRDPELVRRTCDTVVWLEDGQVVEHGAVLDLLTTPGSRLAASLYPPLPAPRLESEHTVVELSFCGEPPNQPELSELVHTFGSAVSVLAGRVDTVHGRRVGQLRVQVNRRLDEQDQALSRLGELGMHARVYP